MDVATHALVPYAFGLVVAAWAGRFERGWGVAADESASRDKLRWSWVIAFAIAAVAPDLDVLYAWARHSTGLFALQHRGLSHSLIGAPVHALLLLFVAHLASVRWPHRFGRLRFRASFLFAAVLGSWSHLVLDIVTLNGVPAFWPFVDTRYSLGIFHWLVPWMFPVSLVILLLHVWGKLGRPIVRVSGTTLLVVLLVIGGLRLEGQPEVLIAPAERETLLRTDSGDWEPVVVAHDSIRVHGALVMTIPPGMFDPKRDLMQVPRSGIDDWIVLLRDPTRDAWTAVYIDDLSDVDADAKAGDVRATSDRFADRRSYIQDDRTLHIDQYRNSTLGSLPSAVGATVAESDAYRGFLLGSHGPIICISQSDQSASELNRVTCIDIAQDIEVRLGARWTPADPMETWGTLVLDVRGDELDVVQYGW